MQQSFPLPTIHPVALQVNVGVMGDIVVGLPSHCLEMTSKIVAAFNKAHAEVMARAEIVEMTLVEYVDCLLEKRFHESSVSVKRQKSLKSRASRITDFLSEGRADRLVSSLSLKDANRMKLEFHRSLTPIKGGKAQNQTLLDYYRIFNYIARNAYDDKYVGILLKVPCPRDENRTIRTGCFSEHQLAALFSGWMYKDYNVESSSVLQSAYSWKFWLMPLALFTGARLNEICQLRVADVFRDLHDIMMVRFSRFGYDRSLKPGRARDSSRSIPVHPELMRMGFFEYVQERLVAGGANALLFPDLKYSELHKYSRAPSRFFCGKENGTLGYIYRADSSLNQAGYTFRSFRRTFAQTLEEGGVSEPSIAALLGHNTAQAGTASKHYLDKPRSLKQYEILSECLGFSVDLSHVRWGNYKPLMESQRKWKARGVGGL